MSTPQLIARYYRSLGQAVTITGDLVTLPGGDTTLAAVTADAGYQTWALAHIKTAAKVELGRVAEQARQAYITPGDGKAAIYTFKRDEAVRWQAEVDAAGTPQLADYPWIAARATRLGVTGQAVADEWNARAAAWEAAGRAIEDAYEAASEAIDALTAGATEADAAAIVEGVVWP